MCPPPRTILAPSNLHILHTVGTKASVKWIDMDAILVRTANEILPFAEVKRMVVKR